MALIALLALAWAGEEPTVEEIEVVAGAEPAESSASVTVVEVEALGPAEDVASAVGAAPGTTVRRLGGLGDFASVSIRGSAARQVEVFLDGVPLNPEGSDVVNLAELPLRAFERIEIFRGNPPPELGAASIGGVVNLVTGDPEGAAGSVGAGSWGTLTGHLSAAEARDEGDLLVSVDGLRTDGRFPYLDDRGTAGRDDDDRTRTRGNNDRQQGTLHARLRQGPWTVLTSGLARETGVPGFTWLPIRAARFRTLRDLLVIGREDHGEATSSAVQAWGQAREERLDDSVGEVGFTPDVVTVATYGAGLRGHVRWAPGPTAAWIGAAELRGAGSRSDGAWLGGRQAAEATGSVVLRDRDERLALTPVLQATALSDAVGGARETRLFATPRLGLLIGLGQRVALTANAGSYLRPPDLSERFGNQGVLVGNPDLRPERGLQADLGLRVRSGRQRAELVGFVGRARDRIGWLQNAQGRARPENLDTVDTAGSELAGAAALGWLRGEGSFTWTRAIQRSDGAADGQQVPGVPLLEWHDRLGIGTDRVEIAHTLDASSGTPLDSVGLLITAPRWIHGVSARATDGPLTVSFDVRNLLDRTTETGPRDPLVDDGTTATRPVTDFLGYPLPGRTVLLTLRLDR